MRKVLIVCLAMIALFSCRKGRLDDYYDDIKGKWKWVYSAGHGVSNNPYYTIVYSPSDERAIEFTGNAKIKFYLGEKKDSCDIIKSMRSVPNVSSGYISYSFVLKHNGDFSAAIDFPPNTPSTNDTLRIYNKFPMDQAIDGHDTMYYYNVFVKE